MKGKNSFREKEKSLQQAKLDIDVSWSVHRSIVYSMTGKDIGEDQMDKLLYFLIDRGIITDDGTP